MDAKFKKIYKHRLFFPGIVLILVLGFLWSRGIFNPRKPLESTQRIGRQVIQTVTGGGFNVTADTPGYENYLELIQGCPGGKDCIQSVDDPAFEPSSRADAWLDDQDVVFVVDHKGVVRAYPQKILNRHEIVNDVVAGDPLTVTFCPLCGSALAFERTVGGRVLEFGVSGKLHNNDLVMYDRQTESLWQQILGEAIVGEMFGTRLKQVSMDAMRWSQFKSEFADGEVLSRELPGGAYDLYPYGNYESDLNPLFPMEVDDTIHPKTVVYGVEVEGAFKAYPVEILQRVGVLEDRISNVGVRLVYDNGSVVATRTDTREELVATRLFWFAWKAFRPETDLYQ